MELTVDIEISKSKEVVWAAITDIENCSLMISSIISIEILNQPGEGVVGLKWKETRRMFGKEASEIMWLTDAVDNEYYCSRAESHGSVYISKLSLSGAGNNTVLTMSFTAQAQTLIVKCISACMGFFIKKSMKNEIRKDLNDIKRYVEQS